MRHPHLAAPHGGVIVTAASRRYLTKHAGHHVITTGGGPGQRTRRRCLTCRPAGAKDRRTLPPGDGVVVLRLIQGEPPERVAAAERHAAVLQLRPHLPVPVIAQRVGCSERTVWRHLADARTTGAAA
jgi:hypothetical protein